MGLRGQRFAQHPRVVPTPPRASTRTKSGQRRLAGYRPDLDGRADGARPRQEGGSRRCSPAAAERGKIELDGHDVTYLPMYQRARLGIGYLPQEASIFRGLNVEDNIRAVLE